MYCLLVRVWVLLCLTMSLPQTVDLLKFHDEYGKLWWPWGHAKQCGQYLLTGTPDWQTPYSVVRKRSLNVRNGLKHTICTISHYDVTRIALWWSFDKPMFYRWFLSYSWIYGSNTLKIHIFSNILAWNDTKLNNWI